MLTRDSVEAHLKAFAADPVAAMQQRPEKRDRNGHVIDQPFTPFDAEQLRSNRFVSARDTVRKQFQTVTDGVIVTVEDILPGKAAIAANDRAENLVDRVEHRALEAMDRAGLAEGRLAESPWSDDYWGIYLGVLGWRYADPSFPASKDWKQNFDYAEAHPARAVAASGDAAAIDRLSPSEKYDLLVGDALGTLTAKMWAEGRAYYDANGQVEPWMGICHGWAPAAYMVGRPTAAVEVLAADGRTKLRFYPSDLKGLASLLWAKARTVTRFVGGRCNDKDPQLDESGRTLSADAFDTNPGTWHLALVNQLGVAKRGLVLDATYDYEVWNQPAFSYVYHYFNPQEWRWATGLNDGIVERARFTRDRFAKFRSPEARYVVGIAMQTAYVVETRPSQATTDAPDKDALNTVDYYYDLELSADGQVLGGEWYVNKHPDFLWTPPPGARATTPADPYAAGDWPKGQPVPETWRRAALRASGWGTPLARVVEQLVAWSRGANG